MKTLAETSTTLASLDIQNDIATITFTNGARHNTLTEEFLRDVLACLTAIESHQDITALVIRAEGRSFSTGGDIKAFYKNYQYIDSFSHMLVGLLNQVIIHMLRLPIPIISRVHGTVTGGSFGFVLASDLVVMADSAFFAPYYAEVGFAPDGGWSAILPDIIGAHRTKRILLLNEHIRAKDALSLGIVDAVCTTERIDSQINEWIDTLRHKVRHALTNTKTSIHTEETLRKYEAALELERENFIAAVTLPETKAGMESFLKRFE